MLFYGGKLAENEPMDRRFMLIKNNRGRLFAKSFGIHVYPRTQVSVYRTSGFSSKIETRGPLVLKRSPEA